MRKKRPSEYDGAPPYEIGKKWGDKEWKEHYDAQEDKGAAQYIQENYFSPEFHKNLRKCPDCGGKFISNTSKFGDKCPKCLQRDEDDMSDAYEARWEDGSGENR